MSAKFNHPLIQNNITKNDINQAIKFLKTQPILTSNKKVEFFEQKWSRWLGIKYSVFVNSGSSANYLTLKAIKILFGAGEVILPPLTWVSDVVSVIDNGFKPVFIDIKLKSYIIVLIWRSYNG